MCRTSVNELSKHCNADRYAVVAGDALLQELVASSDCRPSVAHTGTLPGVLVEGGIAVVQLPKECGGGLGGQRADFDLSGTPVRQVVSAHVSKRCH